MNSKNYLSEQTESQSEIEKQRMLDILIKLFNQTMHIK